MRKVGALRGSRLPPLRETGTLTACKLTLAGGGAACLIHHPAGNHSSRPGLSPRRVSTGSRKFETQTLIERPLQGRTAPLIDKSSEADIIHQPQRQKIRPDTGSAGAHKRQRNAGHRHTPHHHPDIHQHVKQQQARLLPYKYTCRLDPAPSAHSGRCASTSQNTTTIPQLLPQTHALRQMPRR